MDEARNSGSNGRAAAASGAAQPLARAASRAARQLTPRASVTRSSSAASTWPSRLRAPISPAWKRLSSSSQVAKPTTGVPPASRGCAASSSPAIVP